MIMTYDEAIQFAQHEIYKKQKEIENLKECIKYLKNESQSDDKLTQSAIQVLENFGYYSTGHTVSRTQNNTGG